MDYLYCRDCKETNQANMESAYYSCPACGSINVVDATTLIDEAEYKYGEDR